MHPEIVSGMGIATKYAFGTESSLFSFDMIQFLFEQVIEWILAWETPPLLPPSIACPLLNLTIEWKASGMGSNGPEVWKKAWAYEYAN